MGKIDWDAALLAAYLGTLMFVAFGGVVTLVLVAVAAARVGDWTLAIVIGSLFGVPTVSLGVAVAWQLMRSRNE